MSSGSLGLLGVTSNPNIAHKAVATATQAVIIQPLTTNKRVEVAVTVCTAKQLTPNIAHKVVATTTQAVIIGSPSNRGARPLLRP